MPVRILVVTPFAETEWNWFGPGFGSGAYLWTFRNLSLFGERPWTWFGRAVAAARELRNHDVLISHHPYMTYYMAHAMRLTHTRRDHHAFSFNHGNGRFFRGLSRRLAVRAFREVSGFVVYSQREKGIYGEYYQIPLERFSFVHWAVNPPDVSGPLPDYVQAMHPYVCCIGRNNRDFELFLQAIEAADLPAILVSGAGRLRGLRIPPRVLTRCELPAKESFQILAQSALSVVPLRDASTGAGHITIVSAMQFGVPQVVTQLETVEDYFLHGQHGLFVEPSSEAALRSAIERLWRNSDERLRMSRAARDFASTWLTEESSRRHLHEYLQAALASRMPVPCPPGWPPQSEPGSD